MKIILKPKLKEILQQVITATKGEDFKDSIWQFISTFYFYTLFNYNLLILGLLVIENSFLPDKYLFECEIKRLQFNTLGALK